MPAQTRRKWVAQGAASPVKALRNTTCANPDLVGEASLAFRSLDRTAFCALLKVSGRRASLEVFASPAARRTKGWAQEEQGKASRSDRTDLAAGKARNEGERQTVYLELDTGFCCRMSFLRDFLTASWLPAGKAAILRQM
jgi:hypothetical protein